MKGGLSVKDRMGSWWLGRLKVRCSFELGKRIERVIIDYAKQHFEGEHSNSL